MLSQICIENLTGTPVYDYVEVIYRYDERTTHDLSTRENELFQTNVKKKEKHSRVLIIICVRGS